MKILCVVGLLVTLSATVLATGRFGAYGSATEMDITATVGEDSAPDDSLDGNEFNFICVLNSCYADSVNTWTSSLTRVVNGSATTIPFSFTTEEMRTVRDEMIMNGILDIRSDAYPYHGCDSLVRAKSQGAKEFEMTMLNFSTHVFYSITLQYRKRSVTLSFDATQGGRTTSWINADGRKESIDCDLDSWWHRLKEFLILIFTRVQGHQEYLALPRVGCL